MEGTVEGTGDGWSRRQSGEDGKVPVRWPYVELLARLYLGIDTISCHAKRNLSALSVVVIHMRTSLGPDKIKNMMLLH